MSSFPLNLLDEDNIDKDFRIDNNNQININKDYSNINVNNKLFVRINKNRLKTKKLYNIDVDYIKSLKDFNRKNEIFILVIKTILYHFKGVINSYSFNSNNKLIILNEINKLFKLFNDIDKFITFGLLTEFYLKLLEIFNIFKFLDNYLKEIYLEKHSDIIKLKKIILFYYKVYNKLKK